MTGWAIRVTTPPLTQPGEPLTQLFLVAEADRDAAAAKISDLAGGGTEVTVVARVNDRAIKLWGIQPGHCQDISS